MPTLTLNLAKTYALSLKESKADPVYWQALTGQNKLRRFFVDTNWQDYIASVSVSSSGAKGGVFFLEAYVVTPPEFGRQLRAQNIDMSESEAVAIWRALHTNGYLTGGIANLPAQPNAGWMAATPTEVVSAVLKPQVMQPGFVLTGAVFGKNATARNALLSALRAAARLRKRYVVKGTHEPGRTLFAEYVLNTIGKAKIPKSLVLEVDPSRPHNHANPSEGMVMLNLINTRRNPGVDAARYNAAYANLHNGAQPVVDYLVVQKLLGGDQIVDLKQIEGRVVEFLCSQKLIVDIYSFLADPNFAGESEATLDLLIQELGVLGCLNSGVVEPNYPNLLNNLQTLNNKVNQIQAVLAAALPTLANNQLQRQDYQGKSSAKKFDQLVHDLQNQNTPLAQALTQFLATLRQDIARHEQILADATMMRNTGRVHFADALLGNGDRFFQFNTGNFFYVRRQATPGTNKVNNPVGCIDNDSFLPTFLPRHRGEGFQNAVDYVNGALNPKTELWGWYNPQPPGMVMAPNMGVIKALDYDRWFTYNFFLEFIRDTVPTTVLELYSANFFAPGDVTPFPNTQALPGWTQVYSNLREGIARALYDYLNTPFNEFAGVYQALTERYYPGPNFEFTAFKIRDLYLRQCAVDQQTWTIQVPNNPKQKVIVSDIVNALTTSRMVNPNSDNPQVAPIADRALTFGVQQGHITPAEEADIRSLLLTLAVSDQERLLPNPFDTGPLSEISGKERTAFDKKWAALDSKYRRRLNIVICTLLRQFWSAYIAEVGYITNDRARVTRSDAFKAAMALGQQVSNLKLYKDGKTQAQNRQQLLGIQLNLPNYVTA